MSPSPKKKNNFHYPTSLVDSIIADLVSTYTLHFHWSTNYLSLLMLLMRYADTLSELTYMYALECWLTTMP